MNVMLWTLTLYASSTMLALIWSFLILFTNKYENGNRSIDADVQKKAFYKRIPLIFLNISLMYGGVIAGMMYGTSLFDVISSPGIINCLVFPVLVFLLDDAWFYWLHRFMHKNHWFFTKIHSIHHKCKEPLPIEYIYAHPLEVTLGGLGFIPGFLIIYLLNGNISIWTFWVYSAIRLVHEISIHSCNSSRILRKIKIIGNSDNHKDHHRRPKYGNYASFLSYWDRFMGTKFNASEIK